jgi:predicted lipid-binding transport protein (Tim44 family)
MRRKDEHQRFLKRLERERPQPPDEFVSAMSDRLVPARVRSSGWRVAFAGGLTTLLVLAFALTGGIGYAASAVKDSTTAVKTLVVGPSKAAKAQRVNKPTAQGISASNQSANQSSANASAQGNERSSARKQYEEKVAICHRPPGNPDNPNTIFVPESAVPAHLAHGDTRGPCPNGR